MKAKYIKTLYLGDLWQGTLDDAIKLLQSIKDEYKDKYKNLTIEYYEGITSDSEYGYTDPPDWILKGIKKD